MPTPLVDDVRSILTAAGRPLTARERALLLATVVRHDGRERDVVELLDVARRALRYRLRTTGSTVPPELAALLAAVDAVLDPVEQPDTAPARVDERLLERHAERRRRADVDG